MFSAWRHRNFLLRLILIAVTATYLFPQVASGIFLQSGHDASAVHKQILRDWKILESTPFHGIREFVSTLDTLHKDEPRQATWNRQTVSARGFVQEGTKLDENLDFIEGSHHTIELSNESYTAIVEGKEDGNHVLISVLNWSEVDRPDLKEKYGRKDNLYWTDVFNRWNWLKIFRSKGLRITNVNTTNWRGHEAIEVEFNLDFSEHEVVDKEPAWNIKTGRVTLIPDQKHVPVEGSISVNVGKSQIKRVFRLEAEYDFSIHSLPMLINRTLVFRSPQPDVEPFELVITHEVKYDFDTPVRDSDISLSAFGIMEPEWYVPPRPYWLYFSIAGIVTVFAGALIFRFGKRKWQGK